jgi:hypothetical protein
MRCPTPALLLVSVLALAACASRPDNWYRPATDSERASSDERACRDEAVDVARTQARRDANILQDRTGAEFSSASIWRSDLNIDPKERLASEERANIRDLTRACMADRGYRLMRDD